MKWGKGKANEETMQWLIRLMGKKKGFLAGNSSGARRLLRETGFAERPENKGLKLVVVLLRSGTERLIWVAHYLRVNFLLSLEEIPVD